MSEKGIEFLIELQNVDSGIDGRGQTEKTLSLRQEQIDQTLQTIEDDFLDKKEKLKNTRGEKMGKELQIREIDEKLQRHEDEKYRVKSTNEFEALEREIANLEKQKDKEEDYLLGLMEREDELSGLLPSLEKQVQVDRKKLTKEKGDSTRQLANLKKDKEHLIKKREQLFSQIDAVYHNQYEQLRKTRAGLAVVMIEDGVCGGCNVKVSPSLIGQAKRGQIVYCESCSRIIYKGTRSGD